MSSTIASFFSSFVTVHADTPASEEQPVKNEVEIEADSDSKVEPEAEKAESDSEAEPEAEKAVVAAEPEEEEPEDVQPAIREECKASPKCAGLTKHFEHCQERVHSGQGFKGEDCVEELFHMMHCVDADAAPKVFAKLR